MAAQGNGAPGPHMHGYVAPAVGPAAGNGVRNGAAAGAAAVPAQSRFDIEAGLLGSPLKKTNMACELRAQIDET